MLLNILSLLLGLALILSGANFLTDGASALAKRFNISPLVIGLTIVAFGTSAPELTVSIVSAMQGSAELAIGNVVGSNIFNILMIVGITSIVAPITVTKGTLSKEIPLAILSCIVLLICANDQFLQTGPENVIIVAGMNKLCPDLDSAIARARNTAAPMNTVRLNRDTPCTQIGRCADCMRPECICNQFVVTRRSGIPGRIKIILVGETLGY